MTAGIMPRAPLFGTACSFRFALTFMKGFICLKPTIASIAR
jgi:hypothetical protein